MFADDNKLVYTHTNIKKLLSLVNEGLAGMNQWFNSNKLSVNAKKTKYFFHKGSKKDDITLVLPKLTIRNHIETKERIKILGLLLDEKMNWKEHIIYTYNKIAKTLGLLYEARPFLDRNALLALYYSYIETCINYSNKAWNTNYRRNFKKIKSQQKHAIIIIFIKNKFPYTREIFKEQNVLNIYQLNILSNIVFMHRKKLHLPYFTKRFVRILTPIQKIFWLILAFSSLETEKNVSIEFLLETHYEATEAEKSKQSLQTFRTIVK